MSAATGPLVAVAIAGALLLSACGGSEQAQSACTSVRGGPDDAVSFWSCKSENDMLALLDRYGFESCKLVEGMDAEVNPKDSAYQCRK